MKRILVIDDDEQMRRVMRQMLERADYRVIEAPDGKEGLRLFRQQPADLVITDIFMPEKEGLETIVDLHREFPNVKIIAVSGGSNKTGLFSALPHARKLGAAAVLVKPFGRQELVDLVRELLGE